MAGGPKDTYVSHGRLAAPSSRTTGWQHPHAHGRLAARARPAASASTAVMHFVEWTILHNAHGRLMDIDAHLHERVMEEFLVRLAKGPPSLVARRA